MEFKSTNSGTTAKLPILKLGEYEMWVIRIKQYSQIQDYALWEVIENGYSWVSVPQTAQENGTSVTKMSILVIAKEKTNKKNDVKARSFASSAESLDSIFNRLQKIVSRLAILGVVIVQEDLNSKFLSSLPPEWNTHVVVWMNKSEVETMSIDDLYNNFKIVEQKVKKSIGASSGAQNLAFMTAPSTSSTNDANTASPQVSTASTNFNAASPQVSTASPNVNVVYAFMVENPNGSNLLHQDLEQIHEDDLEAMDLKWHFSVSTVIRWDTLPGSIEHQEVRKVISEIKTTPRSKETMKTRLQRQCWPIDPATYKLGLATVEEQLITYRKNEVLFSEEVAVLKREVACKDYEINASKDLDQLLGSQITEKSKKGLGYGPLIYNRPKKLDLSYSGLDEFKELEFKGRTSITRHKLALLKSSLHKLIRTVFPVNKKVEFTKPKNHEKLVKRSVRYAEMYRTQSPRGNQRNWNGQKSNQLGKDFMMYNKACFICGSFNHFQINCDHHQRKEIVSRNNYNRMDAKTTHPSVHRNKSPRVVLLKTGLITLNTVRPVTTAHSKTAVHSAKLMSYFSKQSQSTAQMPFYKQTALTRRYVHTAKRHYYTKRPRVVNTARLYTGQVNAVREKGGKPQQDDKGFVDSGCSRHMTGNIAYLSDFKEFDRGYVAFGGGAYGGRIKGSVTKYYVLFTDTKCLVLSPNFKLPDENQVLLKIPRKDNMYSFDMKNIVPKESLTCLVAKDTLDESML
ncbi:hypothetical protein Tco_1406088 [Tanacetum coccineum]